MSRERKVYTKEFKPMSVELSNTRSDLSSLARELDITPTLLYRWRKEHSFSFIQIIHWLLYILAAK